MERCRRAARLRSDEVHARGDGPPGQLLYAPIPFRGQKSAEESKKSSEISETQDGGRVALKGRSRDFELSAFEIGSSKRSVTSR